ncbi:hypothetical protein ACFWUP_22565 [Nocardia sp. NPDC058658]|uniref:hypothetical protein n=1 Tax=Nocardia sp. NPDC058658 TaxID=3346580 RepID=UPI0036647323
MSRSVPQPPFPSELLADLHADNLAPELREQLWPMVRTDVDALHYLNKLDEVNTHLRTLATDERVMHRMPDDVADRMFRFVADLDAGEGPTERITPLRSIPAVDDDGPTERITPPIPLDRYRSRRRMGLLAAAVAAVAVLASAGVVLSTFDTTQGTPTAAPPTEPTAPDELTTAAAMRALGKRDVVGPLADDAALTRCVQANGIDRAVLGATNITFRGGDAVLVLVQGPKVPTITALVVGTGCTTGTPEQLTLRDIG